MSTGRSGVHCPELTAERSFGAKLWRRSFGPLSRQLLRGRQGSLDGSARDARRRRGSCSARQMILMYKSPGLKWGFRLSGWNVGVRGLSRDLPESCFLAALGYAAWTLMAWCPSSCRLTVEETSDRSMTGCGCALPAAVPAENVGRAARTTGQLRSLLQGWILEGLSTGEEGSWEALRAKVRVPKSLDVGTVRN